MPPIRFNELIIGRRYFIRSSYTSRGPWGSALGLRIFQLLRIEPGGKYIFITDDEHGHSHELHIPVGAGGQWMYYPIEDGLPVHIPIGAPVPAPLPAPLPHGGLMYVPEGTESALMSNIQNNTELVNWGESAYGHYYTAANYAGLPNPKLSPMTRAPIVNPRRYTVTRRVVNNAFPLGSVNAGLFGGRRARKSRRRRGTKSRKSHRS